MKNKIKAFITQSFKSTGKYFLGKTITSLLIIIICLIVYSLLDIKLIPIILILVFFTNFIPVFGPWIGTVISGVIVLFQSPLQALYVVITLLILQIIEQFLLIPLIVGKAVDVKPLFVVVILILSSVFLGFWGVLFAIPLASIIKIGYTIFIRKEDSQNLKP